MKYSLSMLGEIDALLRSARRTLIATDFDGTLCPLAPTPAEVHISVATLEILRSAAACRRLVLAVISGRALKDIKSRLPIDVFFGGNHGLEIAGGGAHFVHDGARQFRPCLSSACEVLAQAMRQWPAAWIEDKGLSATLHFRKVEQCHHNSLLFTARHALVGLGRNLSLRVGRCALEIRPKVQWDKGSALQYIREHAGPFDTCICLGDDRTDESMFRANQGQLNIRIGAPADTAATHYLSDPSEVTVLLSHIVAMCSAEPWPQILRACQAPINAAVVGGLNSPWR